MQRTVKRIHALRQQWLYLTQDVKKLIANCPCCQKKSQILIPIHSLKYVTSTYNTRECLNIDFVGPYPDDRCTLVIIDTFTRWTELFPCIAGNAQEALRGFTLEGDENLQRRCKALCYKYEHIFNHTLNPKPAEIPPFDLLVNT